MNFEDQGMGRVVHSWARLAPAGHAALEEALRVFSPMSQDLTESEQQMASFFQELRKEGARPVVLRSKDVYGYTSCTTETISYKGTTKVQRVQKPSKKRGGRKSVGRGKDVNISQLSRAEKVILHNQPKILLTNLSVGSLKQKVDTQERPQQCLKLTNIKGSPGGHTARLQIHIGADSRNSCNFAMGRPPDRSGIPRSPTESVGQISNVVALGNKRVLSCPFKLDDALIGDSAPFVCQNGYGLKDASMYKKIQAASGKSDSMSNGPVRRLRFQSFSWSQSMLTNGQDVSKLNGSSLECKVIKVDETVTDDELRRKAQKILRVNLSPVIQIHPLV